jgi:hypothetical protein
LPDPFADPAWFTLFILVVRLRGAEGRNRPYLYRQHVESFGKALEQVHGGKMLFDPRDIGSELLRPDDPETK